MWETLDGFRCGSVSARKFMMFFATLLVASFAYLLASATPVHAAATWDDDNLVNGNTTYEPFERGNARGLDQIPADAQLYRSVGGGNGAGDARFIYFQGGAPKSAGEATYILYTLNPPNTYSNGRNQSQVEVTPVGPLTGADTEDNGALDSECTIDGIGWIVCPVMKGVAEGMDFIFERVKEFLVVQPISTSVDNPIYRVWIYSRDLANIAFIIAFLFIIYSHLTNVGLNNYSLKKLLPRLIVAAILVNISYIICSLAVDLSNIAGYSVNSLFENVRDELVGSDTGTTDVNWTGVTSWVLAGGTGAAAAALALPGTIGGASGLWMMLSVFLLGAALIILVTFLILAARQAIIVIFIAIAPLAFVAYLLPGTEKWFEKWRNVFITMLVMFPAFAAVFGGAQLAGNIIIRMAKQTGSIEQIILGLGVMVAPLAITPLLLRLGGGVLNRFGGIINDKQKGAYDRYKNFANDRRSQMVATNNALNAKRRETGDYGASRFSPRGAIRRRAATNYARKNFRDEQKKQDEESAQNSWHNQTGRWGYSNNQARGSERNMFGRQRDGYGNLDAYKRTNALEHGATEAHHAKDWQKRVESSAGLQALQTQTRTDERIAKVIEDSMQDRDNRSINTALNTDPRYASYRAKMVQSTVDKSIADIQSKAIDAAGQQEFRQEVEGSKALSRVVKDTHHATKQAEMYENIVQKAAEKSWNDRVRNDDETKATYLKSVRYEAGAGVAEKRLEEFTTEVRARGEDARGLKATEVNVANAIRNAGVELASRDSAVETLKEEQSSYVLKALANDKNIRMVAGAGTQLGATKVLAKAQSGITKQYLENVKAQTSVYSNDGYRVDEMLKAVQNDDYKLHDGTKVDTIAQHAAIQYVMEDIGNNWSVQKIIEWADTQGMHLVEGQNGQPDKYYDAAAFREAQRTGGTPPPELTASEVSDRRNLMQMVVGGYRNGKNKVSFFTNTLQERVNRGLSISRYDEDLKRDLSFAEVAVLTEASQQKYDANRLTNMDPDELSRMTQLLRDPDFRKKLTGDQRAAIVKKIAEAQSSENTRHLIKDRERGLMNVLASYLELPPDENPPIEDLREIEQYYYEVTHRDENGVEYGVRVPQGTEGAARVKVSVEVPNKYDYTRQADQVDGTGLKEPEQP